MLGLYSQLSLTNLSFCADEARRVFNGGHSDGPLAKRGRDP